MSERSQPAQRITANHRRGFTALEFIVVLLIISVVVYAILPKVGDTLLHTHASVVRQTATAFQESLKLVALRHRSLATTAPVYGLQVIGDKQVDVNADGFPIGVGRKKDEQRPLQASDCEQLWHALLGGIPPSAALQGDSDFRVQTQFADDHGLGCRYRYRRVDGLGFSYFPDDGTVTADVRI